MKKKIIIGMIALIVFILVGCFIWYCLHQKKQESKYDIIEKKKSCYIQIEQNSVTPTSLTCKIYNDTDQELSYGTPYTVEKWEKGKWMGDTIQANWIAIATILKPNSYNEENINWKTLYGKLSEGKYRIIKTIGNTVVSDEFYIKK